MAERKSLSRGELIELLPKPTKNVGGWVMAFCPCHADGQKNNRPSLGVSKAGVIKCMAGCKTADVLKALGGISENGRHPVPSSRKPENSSRLGDPVEVYEYRDVTGRVLAYKGRFQTPDGKEFRWRLPNGEWKDGIKAKFPNGSNDMPLWYIDEAVLSDKPVWVVEGEKACEAVRRQGEVAVTLSGGSSQKEFGDAFEPLRGREFILWPDNDEVGRSYMATIRRHLLETGIAKARQVKVVSPPVPPKGDAYDYFKAGGTVDQVLKGVLFEPQVEVLGLSHYVVRVPVEGNVATFDFSEVVRTGRAFQADLRVSIGGFDPYEQEINLQSQSTREGLVRQLKQVLAVEGVNWASAVNLAYSKVREAFAEMQAGEVTLLAPSETYEPVSFILKPYIIEGGGTLLFGEPGMGKSWTALLMAVSVDAGSDRMWRIARPRKTVFVNLERPAESIRRRLAAVNRALYLDPARNLLAINARGRSLSDVVHTIRHAIKEHGVELVVLDSMSRAGYGDLNANDVSNRIMDVLNGLGVAWLAIGHSPRGDSSHIYGSIMQDAAADIAVAVKAESAGSSIGVALHMTKANDLPKSKPEFWAYDMDDSGLTRVRIPFSDEFTDVKQAVKTNDEAVEDYLLKHGAATVQAIADATSIHKGTVSKLLKKDKYTLVRTEGRKRFYGLTAREDTEQAELLKEEDEEEPVPESRQCSRSGCRREIGYIDPRTEEPICGEHYAALG